VVNQLPHRPLMLAQPPGNHRESAGTSYQLDRLGEGVGTREFPPTTYRQHFEAFDRGDLRPAMIARECSALSAIRVISSSPFPSLQTPRWQHGGHGQLVN
jgi:hypothetical protein